MNDSSRRSSSSFFLCNGEMIFQFRVVILTMILSRSPCVCSSSTGGKKPQKQQRVRRQSQRDQRDPADFNNDYDLLREHLQRENGGPIANFLNFLSENSFGNALNKSDNTNPFAFCYSWFLANVMPLKRQRQGLAGEAMSRATIRDEADRRLDEFILRLERDEKLKEDVKRVKTFWLETATNRSSSNSSSSSSSNNNNNGNMTERYAENLACRTLSLAEHIVSSTEQNTSENQDEVAVRIN